MRFNIGLDLGSGSIRAGAFDLRGRPVRIASRPSVSVAPDPSRPGEMVWPHREVWAATCAVLAEVMAALPPGAEVGAIAAACLGMDGVPIGRDGAALYDFIAWTDTRCIPYYEAWLRDFTESRQFLATGTPPRGFSTLFRLQWMRDHHPEILERTHKWVLMADFVNFRLCGTLATDYSMAACTLLFSPADVAWHKGIADAAGIDLGLMCDPMPAGTVLGRVSEAAAAETGLPAGTLVVLGGHDYLCGVLPVGGHQPGTVVNVGGTWDVIQATLPEFVVPAAAVGTGWTVELMSHRVASRLSAPRSAGRSPPGFAARVAPDLADEAYYALVDAGRRRPLAIAGVPAASGRCTGPVVDNTRRRRVSRDCAPTHPASDLLAS